MPDEEQMTKEMFLDVTMFRQRDLQQHIPQLSISHNYKQ
jgi:hypothetical protein